MSRWIGFVFSLLLVGAVAAAIDDARGVVIYDDDPEHEWNGLHFALLGPDPGFAADDIDAFLLFDVSARLDPNGDGELTARIADDLLTAELPPDPLRRALLQRDLWAMFDRVDVRAHRVLKEGLARALRRLALTREEIEALPDHARAAPPDVVPTGILDDDGPWVLLGSDEHGGSGLTPSHDEGLRHRSLLTVRLSLPGGRAATLEYLARLRRFDRLLIPGPDGTTRTINPEVPQFPVGTRVALVRHALLLDPDAEPVVSPLVESIEMRRFDRIEFADGVAGFDLDGFQDVSVTALSRRALLDGRDGGMRRVDEGELVVNVLAHRYHGDGAIDFLEQCGACHAAAGILSFNSWKGGSGCPTDALQIPRVREPRRFRAATFAELAPLAEWNKRRDARYGELLALWPR